MQLSAWPAWSPSIRTDAGPGCQLRFSHSSNTPGATDREAALAAAPPRPSALARIFRVPEREPVHALLAHISSLSPGERLWFERAVVAGDLVLAPHERLDDGTPAALHVDRLTRQLRCAPKPAADLAECLLALEANAGVIAHYVGEARRRGAERVVAELVALIADLEVVEPVPDTDALDHAEPLGDAADAITTEGRLVVRADEDGPEERDGAGERPTDAWHMVGTLAPEPVRCPGCGARYHADEDTAELPTCPHCGTRDTWEARQPAGYRALLAEIGTAPTRAALARLGRRLYTLRLPRGQAGVAWGRYRIRRVVLEPVGPSCVSPRRGVALIG